MSYIILAFPVFFLLIALEIIFDRLRRTEHYRFNDAITNLSCGLGQQVIGVLLKTVILLGYTYLYHNHRLYDMPDSALTWVALFIGVDFFYYWFHRLAHEISFLWGSHVVHHQSEEYNLTVALRQSWVQSAFSWVFYLPLAVMGFDPLLFVSISSLQTLYQFWIHTKAIDKLPAPLEYIFNTPSHHRVHHAVNPQYIDKNHGGTLIIFDRMFGTFAKEEEPVVYGITTQPKSWNPLWLNLDYWVWLYGELGLASKWSDKIKMLIKPPGWRPAELGGPLTASEVSVASFRKYDTEIPMGLNYYILLQYTVVMLGATLFLMQSSLLGNELKLLIISLVILSLVNLGGIFESKRWVLYLEIARLVVLACILPFLLPMWVLGGIASALMVISLLWFLQYRHQFSVAYSSNAT